MIPSEAVHIPTSRLLQYEVDGETLVVLPQGDCSSLAAAILESELQEILNELSAHRFTGLVVDFERAPFFGSTMLSGLIRLWQSIALGSGRLVLCNVSPPELDVLSATKLDRVWEVYPNRTEALAAVRAN
ncbi:MAG: STAS domain-containing protein [Planctomycetia bacterium]|nr:STAS domain-containing protein [Planctomycetia bacterium]